MLQKYAEYDLKNIIGNVEPVILWLKKGKLFSINPTVKIKKVLSTTLYNRTGSQSCN